jgi:tRNA(adenine34) deaminase
MKFLDEYFMKQALKEAIYAYEKNEIPVGAIIVFNRIIIAQAHNLTKQLKDVTAHAEIQVIGAAESYLKGKKNSLKECSLYVTLEPCIMCVGAILLTKLGRLVFGTSNTINSLHKGTLSKESSLLLDSFFKLSNI